MRVRKGYTAVELVVVLLIMTIIIGIAFGFTGSLFRQFNGVSEASDRPVQRMRIVSTVEEVVTGCISVEVTPQEIRATNPNGSIVVKASDFPNIENVVFVLRGDTVVVDMGGEQYCIPILKVY